ncbi:MAG: transposase, partial [Acidimicrobiia bacterium]
MRLIVRRVPLPGLQDPLWPQFRYHVSVTNRPHPVTVVDREHRQHATVELAIRDLKEGAGLAHLPSGNFAANGAWLVCAALAHNLIRWTVLLGQPHQPQRLTVARTFRTQLIALPARLVNRAGQFTLRLPTHWPWAPQLLGILTRLRHLP